jgi:hypothetical protein
MITLSKSHSFLGVKLTFKTTNKYAFIIELRKGKQVSQFATSTKSDRSKSINWLKERMSKYYRTWFFMFLAESYFLGKIEKHLKSI